MIQNAQPPNRAMAFLFAGRIHTRQDQVLGSGRDPLVT
jgi:hypothetical protein